MPAQHAGGCQPVSVRAWILNGAAPGLLLGSAHKQAAAHGGVSHLVCATPCRQCLRWQHAPTRTPAASTRPLLTAQAPPLPPSPSTPPLPDASHGFLARQHTDPENPPVSHALLTALAHSLPPSPYPRGPGPHTEPETVPVAHAPLTAQAPPEPPTPSCPLLRLRPHTEPAAVPVPHAARLQEGGHPAGQDGRPVRLAVHRRHRAVLAGALRRWVRAGREASGLAVGWWLPRMVSYGVPAFASGLGLHS